MPPPANTHHNSITLCGKHKKLSGRRLRKKRQREELEARGLWLSLFPVLLGGIAGGGRGWCSFGPKDRGGAFLNTNFGKMCFFVLFFQKNVFLFPL